MAKAVLLACAALVLGATSSLAGKPDAADSAKVQSCIKSAGATTRDRERCIGVVADPCADAPGAESTAGQVACAMREFAVWDDILNETFRRLRDKLDAKQKIKLRDMQRAWIESRLRLLLGLFPGHHGLAHECVLRESGDRAPGTVPARLSG
jgi:hypothetical protein